MSIAPVPCPSCKAPVFVRKNRTIVAHYASYKRPCTANNTRYPEDQIMCDHARTVSIPEPHLSDMRRCLDCSEALAGRQIAAAQSRRAMDQLNRLGVCKYNQTPHKADVECDDWKPANRSNEYKPDFLTEADYGYVVEDRIAAALIEGLEPGSVMSETAIRQAQKSPTLRRLFATCREPLCEECRGLD